MSTAGAATFSGLQEGALVLADISGYSKFIAQTEVDHSWSICWWPMRCWIAFQANGDGDSTSHREEFEEKARMAGI